MVSIARNRIDNSGGSLIDIIRNISDRKNYIHEFEDKFAKYVGTKYAIATCSGRYALELILKSLNLKKDNEVIVPAYTFYIVPLVIKKLGLKPVFVDINPETANIDVSQIKKKITKKTQAILVTHLFGRPADLKEIFRVIKKKKIYIIEDCAHAHGTEYKGKKVGSFGEAGFFSLDTTKPVNTFGGGIITTNNKYLMESIRKDIEKLPNSSKKEIISKLKRAYRESFLTNPIIFGLLIRPVLLFSKFSNMDVVGNYQKSKVKDRMRIYKFSNMQAKMGIKQLGILDLKNKKRIFKAKLLLKELDNKIRVLKEDKEDFNIYTSFLILCNNKKELSKNLLLHGIDSDTDMMQNCGKMFSGENFKNTETMYAKALRIPLYNFLNTKQIRYIAKIVKRYAK